jgi:hypothetical protein
MTQHVVEDSECVEVFLDRRGPRKRVPAWSLILDCADHDARKSASVGELDTVGKQIEEQPDTLGYDADRVVNPLGGDLLREGSQPVPDPDAHLAMLGMPGIGERLEQLGIAVRTTAVLWWTGSLAADASGYLTASTKNFDVVLPPVAEVVGVDERGR